VPEAGQEQEGDTIVEMHGVAYVLTRESQFFMGALSPQWVQGDNHQGHQLPGELPRGE
jgi:hypothetical protein